MPPPQMSAYKRHNAGILRTLAVAGEVAVYKYRLDTQEQARQVAAKPTITQLRAELAQQFHDADDDVARASDETLADNAALRENRFRRLLYATDEAIYNGVQKMADRLRREKEELQYDLVRIQDQKTELERTNITLRESIKGEKAAATSLEECKAGVAKLEQERDQLRQKVEELEGKNGELVTQHQDDENKKRALQTQLSTTQKEREESDRKQQAVETERGQAQEKDKLDREEVASKLSTVIQEGGLDQVDALEKIAALEEESADLSDEAVLCEMITTALTCEFQEEKTDIIQLISESGSREDGLRFELTSLLKRSENDASSVALLREQMNDMSKEQQSFIEAEQYEKSDIRSQIAAAIKQSDDRLCQIGKLQVQMEGLSDSIEQKGEELRNKDTLVAQLDEEAESLTKQLKVHRERMAEMIRQLEDNRALLEIKEGELIHSTVTVTAMSELVMQKVEELKLKDELVAELDREAESLTKRLTTHRGMMAEMIRYQVRS